MSSEIEIIAGDVTDLEARVTARYHGEKTGVVLRGTLRGPYCDKAKTLPAEFRFRDVGQDGHVETLVSDPCMWTPEMPHLYQADVEAWQGNELVSAYRGTI